VKARSHSVKSRIVPVVHALQDKAIRRRSGPAANRG
jgi:hypothetical protein